MKSKLTDSEKFDSIIESYINGNITYVKERTKKLSKEDRKALYKYSQYVTFDPSGDVSSFFYKLI